MNPGNTLVGWYEENKRDLPWRNTRDPYIIWLSEIILQQTRVEQGIGYFRRFLEAYPDVVSLANAEEESILKLWQGLGYYSRARNLHFSAKKIVSENGGRFPESYDEIIRLRGVGDYTSAAIASFAFGERTPVVDGNVYRFLSRFRGIFSPVGPAASQKEFREHASRLMSDLDPAIFNQAIMEFGARQCKPVPDCASCPLSADCFAFRNHRIADLPVKPEKTKSRKRFFYYFVIENRKGFFLRKRTDKDIWMNLYDFPLIETSRKNSFGMLTQSDSFKKLGLKPDAVKNISKEYRHVLSHQVIHARFIHLEDDGKRPVQPAWILTDSAKLKKLAVPRLIDLYINEYLSGHSQNGLQKPVLSLK